MNSKKKSKLNKIFSLKYFVYDFIKWTGALSALLFIRPSVRYIDKKSFKKLSGGYIISSNHLQFIDPIILHCAFPFRRLFFIALGKMFETPLKAWFFSHINCISVDRDNTTTETIRKAGEVLQANKILCIFPEGRISLDAVTAVFKQGCAMMSVLNNVPILPVYVEKRKSVFRCTKIIVGKPIHPNEVLGDAKTVMGIEKLNNYLYEKEQELCEYYKNL